MVADLFKQLDKLYKERDFYRHTLDHYEDEDPRIDDCETEIDGISQCIKMKWDEIREYTNEDTNSRI